MKKVTNILNLNEDAAESSVVEAINKLKNELVNKTNDIVTAQNEMTKCKAEFDEKMTNLQKTYDELKKKNDDAEEAMKAENIKNLTNKATTQVEAYVKEGRLKDDVEIKKNWTNKLVADFDGTKSLIDSLPLHKIGVKIVDKTNQKTEASPRTMGAAMLDISAQNKQR